MTSSSSAVIIGGGAIGLCCAYYLRERGIDVTLLDKSEIGHGCSLHNAGYIAPSHFIPLAHPGVITQGLRWLLDPESPFYIKPRLNAELISWVWQFKKSSTRQHVERSMGLLRDLGQESLRLFEELAGLDGIGFELVKKGLLMLSITEKGRSGLCEEVELAHQLGIRAEILSAADLQVLEPGVRFRATGAIYFPDDAHIAPARFVEAIRSVIAHRGVQIKTDTEVVGFETGNGAVRAVQTTRGKIGGDLFVLAGGAWSPALVRDLAITLPLQAGKGYSITYEQPASKPSIPMILTEARVAITPFGDSLRFAGTMEMAGLDLSITQRRVNAILNAVPRYIEGLVPGTRHQASIWGGLRPVTPDGLPYIGRFRRFHNLVAATGHAMVGITLATVTGRLVAEIATGAATSLDIRALHPDRFSA